MPSPPPGDDGTIVGAPTRQHSNGWSDPDPVLEPDGDPEGPTDDEGAGGPPGRRRWVLPGAIGGAVLVAAVVVAALLLSNNAPAHRPGAAPGSPPASPARVRFEFRVASTTVTSYNGKGNAAAARKAAERIRVALSDWYDAAFMNPTEWQKGPAASAFGVFDPKVRGRARKDDLKSLSLGEVKDLESLAPTSTRLTVRVLLDPSLHAIAAVATVRFDAEGRLASGDLLSVDNGGSFVFRLSGSKWLIEGYEGVKTKVNQHPAPSPSPTAGPSATASASA
jgi:hypothetical protein